MSLAEADLQARRPSLVTRGRRGLLGAVGFLTIVPVRGAHAEAGFDLGAAVPWFPALGAAVGALGGGVRAGCEPLFGRGPATVLAIAAIVLVTGGLHADALADTFDGLGVRGDRTRRLAVMRDSTLGAFGVLALVIWFLLLLTALEQLPAGRALRTLIAAAALGRLAAVLHGALAPPARRDGLGAGMRVGGGAGMIGGVVAIGAAGAAVGPLRGALAVAVAGIMGVLSALSARRAVGGSTGDTLGAAVAVAEVAVCLALVASWT